MSVIRSDSLLEELKPKEALALLREELAQANPHPRREPSKIRLAADTSIPGVLLALAGQTPWWVCSLALHGLAILLLGLLFKSIELPDQKEVRVVDMTPVSIRFMREPEPVIKIAARPAVAERTHVAKPKTAPAAVETNVVIAPRIQEIAEVGDHFETINPDRPDTHSAFGNPDAHLFHSVHGVNAAAGGGGSGGELLRDALGMSDSASAGTGGGWGGGRGSGVGVDEGKGRGSFGQRNGGGRKLMVKRFGGSEATEAAVVSALRWLADNQERDGHWNCVAHFGEDQDVAVTSFALMAFLGAGHSETAGEYRENVRRGIIWLRNNQRSIGAVGVDGYEIAIATLALCEAAGMNGSPETRRAAQRAVDYSCNLHQSRLGAFRGGWRYRLRERGDLSITGWFVMALASAKVAGLTVDPESLDGASRFVDGLDLSKRGSPLPGYGYFNPDETTPRLTAIGTLTRHFLGAGKEELQKSAQWVLEHGKVPGETMETDLYYWYYGTYCAFYQGGTIWQKWNEALKPCLTRTQIKLGDDAGSWPPRGMYSAQWGRVGQTALSAMCLEVYYRNLGVGGEFNP